MAKRGRKVGGEADAGLLGMTFTQLWEMAGALGMEPHELAERIDPAVRKAQRERARQKT
jgi:hypothetical protein